MDIATIVGMLAGLGLVGSAIFIGGSFEIFLDPPAILIVVGGMLSATCIHFSIKHVFSILAVLKKTIFNRLPSEKELTQLMVNFAAINRRDGALALEQHLQKVRDQFLVKGVRMLIDGQKEEAIASQMELEIQYLQERHADGKKMFEFMGAAAPAFGMVGTLIGLVQMLQKLDDPSKIGAGMATSLVCTFYGAFLANVLLLPIAGKLGLSELHYALVLIIAMGVGGFMPLAGVGFYVCCAIMKSDIEAASHAMLPYLAVVLAGLLLVAFVPWFALFLPHFFGFRG
jgi:chemotaxis protein MotA